MRKIRYGSAGLGEGLISVQFLDILRAVEGAFCLRRGNK